MRFQILSHAGLLVEGQGKQLLCDPWVVGSSYWRSWWNYPPPPQNVVEALKPDCIYLTHIHWDHFHGPSLRRFDRSTPIVVPKGNYARIRRDLGRMGFKNVIELADGCSHEIAPGFRLTSYQFGPFMDSAAVVECDGTTILNVNDAPVMGPPLRRIAKRHKPVDFVLRSHSSANPFLCYDVMDDPDYQVDDYDYVRFFALIAMEVGATYAVPFASNMCHLHPETIHFNDDVVTPADVEAYFLEHDIRAPELRVMVAGDAWEGSRGQGTFNVASHDWFTNRSEHIARLAAEAAPRLEATAAREAKATVKLHKLQRYFGRLHNHLPRPLRRWFKGHPITIVATGAAGEQTFRVNLAKGTVEERPGYSDEEDPFQIHAAAYLINQCVANNMWAHLGISKRVRYRVRKDEVPTAKRLDFVFTLDEYEIIPLRHNFRARSLQTWLLRWREVLLYARWAFDLSRGGVEVDKYFRSRHRLPPSDRMKVNPAS